MQLLHDRFAMRGRDNTDNTAKDSMLPRGCLPLGAVPANKQARARELQGDVLTKKSWYAAQ
jgi:hypothetical protein